MGTTPAARESIAFARRTVYIDGKEVPLSPGMTVTVEVLMGERRAIDYLLAPQAAMER